MARLHVGPHHLDRERRGSRERRRRRSGRKDVNPALFAGRGYVDVAPRVVRNAGEPLGLNHVIEAVGRRA
jgi:hypothetical protein